MVVPARDKGLNCNQLLLNLWTWSVDVIPLHVHTKPDEPRPKTCSKKQSKLVRKYASISPDDLEFTIIAAQEAMEKYRLEKVWVLLSTVEAITDARLRRSHNISRKRFACFPVFHTNPSDACSVRLAKRSHMALHSGKKFWKFCDTWWGSNLGMLPCLRQYADTR